MKTLSLPHEHGGYLTLAGAAAAAMVLAPRPLAALGVALALAAGFFARGPLEAPRPARFDWLVLTSYFAIAIGGTWLSRQWWTVALPAAIVGGSLWVRATRRHRHPLFELVGMAALGASAGLMAFAGGVRPSMALLASLVVGAHAGVAVPLVRTELRPRERQHGGRAELVSFFALAVCAIATALVGPLLAALAFLPRFLHLGARRAGLGLGWRPSLVGIREVAELTMAVTILVLALK
jgi:hypothetical protein